MTVLTFSEDLYSGFAIDEAAKAYAGVATFSLEKAAGLYRVALEAIPSAAGAYYEESTIALEFQNFALGATIDRLKTVHGKDGPSTEPAPETTREEDRR